MTALSFSPFSLDGFDGYQIAHAHDDRKHAVRIGFDAEGRVLALSASAAGDAPFSDWEPLDPLKPGHWAYAMLSGQPTAALLEKLAVPEASRAALARELRDGMADSIRRCLPGIDEDAVAAMAKGTEKRLSTYAFLAESGERGRYRRQAANAYPVFADLLNGGFKLKLAVDRGAALVDVLAPLLSSLAGQSVGKALLKRFASAPALPEGMRLAPVIRFAASIQPDWFPKDEAGWEAFYHLADGLVSDLQVPSDYFGALVAGSKGDWDALVSRAVRSAYPDPEHPAHSSRLPYLRAALIGCRDMVESFVDAVVLPLVAHAQDADQVYLNPTIRAKAAAWGMEMLLKGRPLPDVLDLSRRFHQEQADMFAGAVEARLSKLKSQVAEGGWPGLTAPVQAPNGYWIVPLCTDEELREEGRHLNHCVGRGGYSAGARTCSHHIVSVRRVMGDGSLVPCSTAQFEGITEPRPDLTLRQHRAYENSLPGDDMQDALSWYRREVRSGGIPTNWELINAFVANELVSSDQVERGCGYDWREREELDRAVRPWGAFVTKAYRTRNLDSLMDSPEAAAVIEQMTPDFLSARPA